MFSNIKSMSKEEVQQLLSTDFVNGLDKGAVIARTKKKKRRKAFFERNFLFQSLQSGVRKAFVFHVFFVAHSFVFYDFDHQRLVFVLAWHILLPVFVV